MATQVEATNALDLVRFANQSAIGTNALLAMAQDPAKNLNGTTRPASEAASTTPRRRRTKPWILSPSIINPGEWMIPPRADKAA